MRPVGAEQNGAAAAWKELEDSEGREKWEDTRGEWGSEGRGGRGLPPGPGRDSDRQMQINPAWGGLQEETPNPPGKRGL